VDSIFENASNKYKLGLAVPRLFVFGRRGTQQTFGDRAAECSIMTTYMARDPVIQVKSVWRTYCKYSLPALGAKNSQDPGSVHV
jgi:hypothetical protein